MTAPPYSFFATCPAGFENVLGKELKGLGCNHIRPLQGGVSFEGDISEAYRACLWCRTASRILKVVERIDASTADNLYSETLHIDWPGIFTHTKTIAIYAKGTNKELRNTQFTALKVKDAICDSFRKAGLPRPSVNSEDPDVRLQVTIHGHRATIYVDYAGDSLHRRGYRIASKGKSHEAPLKEALGAGMLLWAGWNKSQLYDPVCGSGTLVIESAMIATDMAPGLLRRKWGFEGLRDFSEQTWERLVAEAGERFETGLANAPKLLGSDIDPEAIEIAKASAKAMGLGSVTCFVQGDCACMRRTLESSGLSIESSGLVAMNPPYGIRLLEGSLDSFYKKLAEGLSELSESWDMVAITPDALFDAHIGLDAKRTLETYNGPIEASVRYYQLGSSAYAPLKIITITGKETEIAISSAHSDQFAARLRKAAKQTRKWAKREKVNAFRIYDRDLPDYSLSIDEYTDSETGDAHLMVSEYKAPGEIDPVKAARRANDAVAIATATLEIEAEHVHTRMRKQDTGGSQYAKGTRNRKNAPSEKIHPSTKSRTGAPRLDSAADKRELSQISVEEGGHLFEVHMEGALDTGLFLDHRPVRKMIESEAGDKHFLNLFAYTGSVSVYAAAGGASSTTTVDMNKGYLEWAERNMRSNGFIGKNHRYIRRDVLEWLDSAEGKYDLVFVDPPTFSNSKSMSSGSWDIQRDHVAMLANVRRLLTPGATVYFSGNLRSFKLDEEAVLKLGFEVQDITSETIPEDFKRNQKIHFCYRLKI